MRVQIDNDGGYMIYQENANNDILKEHGLDDRNLTRTFIGTNCYGIPKTDIKLFADVYEGAPSI